jgi:hypothetical protein
MIHQTRKDCLFAGMLIALLSCSGCGKKGDAKKGSNPKPVSDEEIAGVRKALAQGMQPIGFTNIKSTQVGKGCLVEAQTPDGGLQIKSPPPPPGMIQIVGQVIFYRGELDSISPESLTMRKAYPTAGNFKKIEIPKGDIRSIYLVP